MSLILPDSPARLLRDDIEHVVQALPELERLAKVKLKSISPPAVQAIIRLQRLSKSIKGV